MGNKNKRFNNRGSVYQQVTGDKANTILKGLPTGPLKRNVGAYISPVQLQRIRQDVLTWRQSIFEAEAVYTPFRVKMQQMYQDTILNGHVYACWQKRKGLTLQKNYEIVGPDGVANEEWTKYFQNNFFKRIINYSLDKQAFGYTLVNYTKIENNMPADLKLIKRQNVSPDRLNVTSFPYLINGEQFTEPENEFYPWTFYFSTYNDTAASECGYGYLYNVGIYEIFLRNILGYNGDFVELYSQPYRVGKTQKTNGQDREDFENSLKNMGSAGWAVIDPDDMVEFLNAGNSGTGWQGYANFEERLQKLISKVILFHADAMDSKPGKLGASDIDVQKALQSVELNDCDSVTLDFNTIVIPKLRQNGISIPDGLLFQFKNDKEKQEERVIENESNLKTAEIAKTMKDAGLQMSPEYFKERTGIDAELVEVVPPMENKEIATRIKNFYNSI